ncbi:nuclear transport factor 2 family protein [Rhizorhabdus dicambivorans]|nr:nuclear transport factor 2 family protein [Rhizorhabdus dicambivorans]
MFSKVSAAPMIGFLLATITAVPGLAASQPPTYSSTYAQDRAEIEDLQARYMFAFDWLDADTYASTFTEDGVLDWANGKENGRDAIRAFINKIAAGRTEAEAKETPPLRRIHFSHDITNLVLKIEGNHATARAYWLQFRNSNPERKATLAAYGHYEDQLVKVNGRWLFKYRKIYNEQLDRIASKGGNPAW